MFPSTRFSFANRTACPVVMGVLNVTPDSFSDGGSFKDAAAAARRAGEMVAEGAAIIDVGPESTRPGAAAVPPDEQIRRIRDLIPAIRAAHADIALSIDTRSADVAREAILLGADIINDVSALRDDPAMVDVVRESGAAVVLMHMRGTPATMQRDLQNLVYDDVVGDIAAWLTQRAAFAESRGVPRNRIAIDPGIGFGKTVQQNLMLMRRLDAFVELGLPVVVGASRKSFIGAVLNQDDPGQRRTGSLACAVAATLAGARIIRAHDVAATVDAVRMAQAIRNSAP